MLQLRRNEKDFMLRNDLKYVGKLTNNLSKMHQVLERSQLETQQKKNITDGLNKYQKAFKLLVDEQIKLGLHSKLGLQLEMQESVQQVSSVLTSLINKTDEIIQEYVRSVSLITYSVFFLVIITSVIIAWFTGNMIINGISTMKNSMLEITKTNDLTIKVNPLHKDELGDMANAFNTMLSNFQSLVVSVNHSVSSVNQATRSLLLNIEQSNLGVNSQMQETDMVATAVTEMVATIEEIANNTSVAADKAEQTTLNANQGKKDVDTTISQMNILTQQLTESESVVNELAQDSITIGSVLSVIRSIADQTNLLALNAAIEAARAGEHGRGFAVVADEVRALASRTQESTKEIEDIVDMLQTRTSSIVKLMGRCKEEGLNSVAQAAQAGSMLDKINGDVASIMDMNTAIATAIQEQSAVASEVNRHVITIRDVAEHASDSAEQNHRMSQELSSQATQLSQEVSRFSI
tara:strand:+ start:9072 stop:10463 length:1392 start_codon:yes stop_codon:yes gene_type:complete